MSVHLPNADDDRLRDMYDDMLRDHSGNVVPEELLPHEDGCACFACMKQQKEEESDE